MFQRVVDGLDVDAIDAAIQMAKEDPRPSIIIVKNIIGYGLPTRAGTEKAHGEPPGEAELNGAKQALGWPEEPRFLLPGEAVEWFRASLDRGETWEQEWNQKLSAYREAYPELAAELERRLAGRLPEGWDANLPVFPADTKGVATRVASGKVINALAAALPELVGGSADLAPSTKTWIDSSPGFQANCREGRNFNFGVREHGMGSVVNGMTYHGGVIAFGSTFLVFADYMRPPIRLSAISHLGSIWVFTHDSIGVGEDGPTHQPIDMSLRCAPSRT